MKVLKEKHGSWTSSKIPLEQQKGKSKREVMQRIAELTRKKVRDQIIDEVVHSKGEY